MIPYRDFRLSFVVLEQIMVQDGVKNGKIWMHCCYVVGQTYYTSLYERRPPPLSWSFLIVWCRTLFNCAKIRRCMKKSPSFLFSLCWTKNKQTILPSFRIPILKHFFNLKPKQSGIEIDDNSLNETTIWEWLTGNVGIGFDDADRWDNCEIRDIGRLGFVLLNAWKSSCSL